MTEDTDETRIAELEADNRRLRRLLEQRDAPAELRHRLNSTLATLRTVIRRSAETHRDLDDYVAHLEDRLDAVMRAQAAADERGSIELHGVVVAELFHYGAKEGEQVSLSGPEIHFQPRAGQVLALAFHELAVNAVEHGGLGGGQGRVIVSWTIEAEAEPAVTLTWKELGQRGVAAPPSHGFGTEVLTRMVAYELQAKAAMAFEPDGLRYTLRFPLTEKVGTVATLGGV